MVTYRLIVQRLIDHLIDVLISWLVSDLHRLYHWARVFSNYFDEVHYGCLECKLISGQLHDRDLWAFPTGLSCSCKTGSITHTPGWRLPDKLKLQHLCCCCIAAIFFPLAINRRCFTASDSHSIRFHTQKHLYTATTSQWTDPSEV